MSPRKKKGGNKCHCCANSTRREQNVEIKEKCNGTPFSNVYFLEVMRPSNTFRLISLNPREFLAGKWKYNYTFKKIIAYKNIHYTENWKIFFLKIQCMVYRTLEPYTPINFHQDQDLDFKITYKKKKQFLCNELHNIQHLPLLLSFLYPLSL